MKFQWPELERRHVGWAWLALVLAALGWYFLHRNSASAQLEAALAAAGWATGVIYLLLGCLRGFTLIPATYLLLAGMAVLAPWPLWLLTLAGILVSSWSVYFCAGRLELASAFEVRYPRQLKRLRAALGRHELGAIIAWSFFPLAPTDVICYACGALGLSLRRCLLGVLIGEGAVCALYVYGLHVLWHALI